MDAHDICDVDLEVPGAMEPTGLSQPLAACRLVGGPSGLPPASGGPPGLAKRPEICPPEAFLAELLESAILQNFDVLQALEELKGSAAGS